MRKPTQGSEVTTGGWCHRRQRMGDNFKKEGIEQMVDVTEGIILEKCAMDLAT